jgi:molybdopterin molybdotransferase
MDHLLDACCSPIPNGAVTLSVEEARAAMLASARTLPGLETLACAQALGRVLAEEVRSPIDVPPHANSAMDGYALRAADLAQEGPDLRLPVAQRIAAGQAPQPLAPGTAARIFTGAPIPAGADTVVPQESCRVEGGWLLLEAPPRVGSHIRPRGNDLAAGSLVVAAGTRLDPRHLGLLAAVGRVEVSVRRPLRVAILTTGDELAEPGEPLQPGQIYNSNRPLLAALLQGQGCALVDPGPVQDEAEATRAALCDAARGADLIVSTGGVSVGEEDHVKAAVESVGRLDLWRVRMKPGKPVAFGHIDGAYFVGLPGNPVSAWVTAHLFLLPLLRRLQGRTGPEFPEADFARLGQDWPNARARREFPRVSLVREAGHLPWAEPYERQGSEVLAGVAWADGLIEIPEHSAHARGAILRYWSFARLQA